MFDKHPKIEEMFRCEDQKREPYQISAFGSQYTILPNVFSPEIRSNSLWYAEKILKLISGDSFLEVGAGAGILSVEAAKKRFKVVATDVDHQAVKNIALNSKNHNVSVDVREGDVFSPIQEDEKFDNIFWNHPWIFSEKEVDDRHKVTYDYNYEALEKFIKLGKNHLKENGRIFLGTGNLARIDLIQKMAEEAGLKINLECKEEKPLASGDDYKTEFYIYSFTL